MFIRSGAGRANPARLICSWMGPQRRGLKRCLASNANGTDQGLKHKVFGYLWACLLECGADPVLVRAKLARIRSVTSDLGVEAGLADVGDSLSEFFAAIGAHRSSRTLRQERHLFPGAVFMPGWQHMWGNIAGDIFQSFVWCPAWLRDIRALASFAKTRIGKPS